MHNVELLVDVSSLEMLKSVAKSECDAIFIGNEIETFSDEDLKEAIDCVHENNKKIYVAFNKIPHEKDILESKAKLIKFNDLGVDAIVINEPGMVMIIKEILPTMEVHLGEEANITNYETANFWYDEGIKRVVVSKELSAHEIGQVRASTPLDLDIEVLVHGSMQISHSGRKLLSNFVSNKSDKDSQSCDFKNKKYSLMEEKRPGLYFPISEDDRGTFLYNTEDLCMINDLQELIKSGVTSFKIDSKFRDINYMLKVVDMYRKAIEEVDINTSEIGELLQQSNRSYTTAFYLDNEESQE